MVHHERPPENKGPVQRLSQAPSPLPAVWGQAPGTMSQEVSPRSGVLVVPLRVERTVRAVQQRHTAVVEIAPGRRLQRLHRGAGRHHLVVLDHHATLRDAVYAIAGCWTAGRGVVTVLWRSIEQRRLQVSRKTMF